MGPHDSGFCGDLMGGCPNDLAHSPNRGVPDPVRQPACYYGCGDYPEWLTYEAAAWRKEQRSERAARFAECVDLPPGIYKVVDGRVVSAVTGLPFEPIRDQIAALQAKQQRVRAREQRRADRETLKPIVDLYSIFGGA